MARTCSPDRRWFVLALALLLGASTPSPEREARIRATTLCDRGDWVVAEPFLRDALARFGAVDSDDVWEMRLLFVDALTGLGKYDEASAVLAPAPPPRLTHSSIAIRRLLAQAIISFRQRKPETNALLTQAETLARTYEPKVLAEVLADRANIEAADNYSIGERYARDAIRLARKYHRLDIELKALGGLARLLTFQGRYDEAIDVNRRALALARAGPSLSKVEKIAGNLAWAYTLLGDFDAAAVYLGDALKVAEKIGADFDAASWLNSLGDIALYNRDFTKAQAFYYRGISVARRIKHRDLGEFIANEAVVLLNLGDTAGARKANDESRTLIAAKSEELLLRSRLIDARIDAQTGQIDSAIAKVRRVIDVAKPAQKWEAQARLAQFLVIANRRADAGEQFKRAIETAAGARETVKDEELRLPFGALVRETNEKYVELLLSDKRVPDALQVVETSRAQTLDEALGAEAAARSFDPQRIARNRGAVILSYWLTPKQSYVWTITPSSIEVEQLPPAKTIEDAIDTYARDIQTLRTGEASRARAAKLYSMLVPRALTRSSLQRGARIIVVPDGRLHAFNLETLVNPASKQYWIDDVTIETVNSLELLENSRTSPASQSMLLVGDPPSPDREFPRLMNAADEIARVKKHFTTSTVLEGARATPRAYENANPGRYGWIHFVAHGTATRQQPLDSAVILARDGDSYKLYARDILKHPLQARLVTISSCHGAGLRAYTGEGLVGLAWAFLHAGARQVIAALWEVNDSATPQLMDDLYQGIRSGHDPATALRSAKLKLIHEGGINRQPRYWAPFVLYSGS